MRKTRSSKISFLICSLTLLFGCQKDDEKVNASDVRSVSEEAVLDTYYQDIDDLGTLTIDATPETDYWGGRTATITVNDDRFCDNVIITVTPDQSSTYEVPVGVILVDFGTTGCTDARGNVRKGKLIFSYEGWRFNSGSVVTLTTENYSINGVKLSGTRTSTNVTATQNDPPTFNVVLTNGEAIFADNSTAVRESDITWSWIRGANPSLDKLIVASSSTASGITREGHSYEVSLLEDLEYHRLCPIAVSGVKKYLVDGDKEITIDYGTGTCDKTVTLTVNGITRTMTVS